MKFVSEFCLMQSSNREFDIKLFGDVTMQMVLNIHILFWVGLKHDELVFNNFLANGVEIVDEKI